MPEQLLALDRALLATATGGDKASIMKEARDLDLSPELQCVHNAVVDRVNTRSCNHIAEASRTVGRHSELGKLLTKTAEACRHNLRSRP